MNSFYILLTLLVCTAYASPAPMINMTIKQHIEHTHPYYEMDRSQNVKNISNVYLIPRYSFNVDRMYCTDAGLPGVYACTYTPYLRYINSRKALIRIRNTAIDGYEIKVYYGLTLKYVYQHNNITTIARYVDDMTEYHKLD